jgi:hypothetical protein
MGPENNDDCENEEQWRGRKRVAPSDGAPA